MRRRGRRLGMHFVVAASLAATGCLEPNPNAIGEGGTEASTGGDSGTEGGTVGLCDPCEFAFESLSFEANGTQTFSIPKPDRPHTVPFATITKYAPGNNADSVGYAMAWTDVGDAYELELTLTGESANTKVGGVAVVLGFSDELGAPEVQEVQVAADACAAASLAGLDDRVYLDAVERYEPGPATVLSYARTVGGDSLEYCITQADAPEASLTYKVVMFSLPDEHVVSVEVPELELDTVTPRIAEYEDLGVDFGASTQLVHLIGARSFDEGSETALGYNFSCTAQSPFGCVYELLRFKAGARAVSGGSIIAIQ